MLMLCGKDAFAGLFGVLAAALISGCAESSQQLAARAGKTAAAMQPATPLAADSKPIPELRIPYAPKNEHAGSNNEKLVQAGAQSPAPSAGISRQNDAGPPLAPPGSSRPELDNPQAKLRQLYREAADNYAAVDSYIVRLRRREQVNGRDKPEETLLAKFRKQPFSVYFKWLSKEGAGRELVFVKGQYEDKMHMLLAAGDMPLVAGGKRMALAPDSVLVRSSSRHSIYEAGIGSIIERLGIALEAIERGDFRRGTLKYLGKIKRPEFEAPCDAIEQIIPLGAEPLLPKGGRRLMLMDPATRFPTLVITQDETGREVEYYCFDRFQFPVRLDDDDFNPDKLWPPRPNSLSSPPSPPRRPPETSPNREGPSPTVKRGSSAASLTGPASAVAGGKPLKPRARDCLGSSISGFYAAWIRQNTSGIVFAAAAPCPSGWNCAAGACPDERIADRGMRHDGQQGT
jgi:Protein of unknown function (DUF1571)